MRQRREHLPKEQYLDSNEMKRKLGKTLEHKQTKNKKCTRQASLSTNKLWHLATRTYEQWLAGVHARSSAALRQNPKALKHLVMGSLCFPSTPRQCSWNRSAIDALSWTQKPAGLSRWLAPHRRAKATLFGDLRDLIRFFGVKTHTEGLAP